MNKTTYFFQIMLMAMVIAAQCTTGSAQDPTSNYKAYKNIRPMFSMSYPQDLVLEKWPDGITLTDEKSWPRDVVQVSNDAFPRGYFNYVPIRIFEILRQAKPGEVKPRLTDWGYGVYYKIENITVEGYPAVKVIYDPTEFDSSADQLSSVNSGQSPQPIFVVSVYVKYRNKIWEISSPAATKAMREERALILKRILSTFTFR